MAESILNVTTGNGLGPLTPNGILTFIEYSRLTVKSTIELAVCNRENNEPGNGLQSGR